MRRKIVPAVIAVLALAGCGTSEPPAAPATPAAAASTKAPLSPDEFASMMAGQPNDLPPAPDQRHRVAYLAALAKVNPELIEDRDPDALVNRAVDQCRDIKERPQAQWLTWVKTRFGSPEHPNGFDDETSAKVLAVIRKYICPNF